MVSIRLSRGGSKKRPFYHVVVTDSRSRRDGRYIERVGYYNPIATGEEIVLQLNMERIDYWISKGAKPSEKVNYLIDNFAEIVVESEKKAEAQKEQIAKVAKEEKPKAKPAEKKAKEKAEEEKPAKEETKTAEKVEEAEEKVEEPKEPTPEKEEEKVEEK